MFYNGCLICTYFLPNRGNLPVNIREPFFLKNKISPTQRSAWTISFIHSISIDIIGGGGFVHFITFLVLIFGYSLTVNYPFSGVIPLGPMKDTCVAMRTRVCACAWVAILASQVLVRTSTYNYVVLRLSTLILKA